MKILIGKGCPKNVLTLAENKKLWITRFPLVYVGANGVFASHFWEANKYSEHSCSGCGGIGAGQYKCLAFLRHTARFYLTDSKLYPEMVFKGFYPVLRIATGSFTP